MKNLSFYNNKCGLYLIINSSLKILYCGRSKDLGKRIASSVNQHNIKFEEGKLYHIDICVCNSHADMIVYELYYINKYKPKHNVSSKQKDELTISLPPLRVERITFNKNNNSELELYELEPEFKGYYCYGGLHYKTVEEAESFTCMSKENILKWSKNYKNGWSFSLTNPNLKKENPYIFH